MNIFHRVAKLLWLNYILCYAIVMEHRVVKANIIGRRKKPIKKSRGPTTRVEPLIYVVRETGLEPAHPCEL